MVLALGSTAPGLLGFAIDRFSSVFPDYRERVLGHEAAHFLVRHEPILNLSKFMCTESDLSALRTSELLTKSTASGFASTRACKVSEGCHKSAGAEDPSVFQIGDTAACCTLSLQKTVTLAIANRGCAPDRVPPGRPSGCIQSLYRSSPHRFCRGKAAETSRGATIREQ